LHGDTGSTGTGSNMKNKFILKKLTLILLISVFLFLNYGFCTDQVKDEKHKINYFESTALFKYIVKLPNGYSGEKKYNLVIALHGGNGDPESFSRHFQLFKESSDIFVFPQGPFPWLVNGKLGYDWSMWPSGNNFLVEKAALLAEKYIIDLVKIMSGKYKLNKIYILGFSQGAIFALRAGIKNPGIVNGIISLSGPGLLKDLKNPFSGEPISDWLPEKYIKNGNKLRVFIANGDKDKSTTVELGVRSRDILFKFGYDVTFMNFDGRHEIKSEVLVVVLKWLNK